MVPRYPPLDGGWRVKDGNVMIIDCVTEDFSFRFGGDGEIGGEDRPLVSFVSFL